MPPKIILIHPPLSKCSEPPPGLAKISASLTQKNIPHEVIDANLEGIFYLLRDTAANRPDASRWTARACKNLDDNLKDIRDAATYKNQSRYQRAVMDINHLLNIAGKSRSINLSLSDYQDENRTPVHSADLIAAAENPQANPFYSYFNHRLTAALENNPDFIGFSLNYLSQALCAFAMIGMVKKIHPRSKIILGGSLMTSWMKLGVCKKTFRGLADFLVEGPGEQPLLALLSTPSDAGDTAPDYSRFRLDEYLAPGRILPYSTARGCYWRQCAFCPEKAEGNDYRPLAVTRVTSELQMLTQKLKPALVHILDSAISPAMLGALVENPPGADWYGFARVTSHLADASFCAALKESGCKMLQLGIESGDQHILDHLQKGIRLNTASVVLKNLKKAGIATYCYFLFGTPPETSESAVQTLDFIRRHHDVIDFLNLAIFNLPVLAAETQDLAVGEFYAGDLSLYKNFRHPRGWHRADVRFFLEKKFKKDPVVLPIVKRTPEFFTANHAPFFV